MFPLLARVFSHLGPFLLNLVNIMIKPSAEKRLECEETNFRKGLIKLIYQICTISQHLVFPDQLYQVNAKMIKLVFC